MSRYTKLKEMIKECGWPDEDDETLDHLTYHFFLESVCCDLVNEYGVDAVVDAMYGREEEDGSAD